MIINQSPKYPKDGPFLDHGEKNKYEKYLKEFQILKTDMKITNEILTNLSVGLNIESLAIIKRNHTLKGG